MAMKIGIGLSPASGLGQSGAAAWELGADISVDFQTNTYRDGGVLYVPSARVTDTHAATITADDLAGHYSAFAPNALVRTDRGLQTVPSKVQMIPGPADFAGWTGGAIQTVSPFPAPNGGAAIRLEDSDVASYMLKVASIPLPNDSSAYMFSVYVRKTAGTAATVACNVTWQGPGSGKTTQAPRIDPQTGGVTASGVLLPSDHPDWWRWGIPIVNNGTGYTGVTISLYPAARETFGGVDTLAAVGFADFWAPNMYLGTFAAPPILSAATVPGNQQVLDLTGRLGSGVLGFVQVETRQAAESFKTLVHFSDGAAGDEVFLVGTTGGNMFLQVTSGGIQQAVVTIPGGWPANTVATIAFAAGPNFAIARTVGQAAPAADTSVAYPPIDRCGIGGAGYNPNNNAFVSTCKLALKFAAPDAAGFDSMYALAEQAAAT